VITNNPPYGQDGKGKGKGKGKQDGKGEGGFIDAYTNYLGAAADVFTSIIPLFVWKFINNKNSNYGKYKCEFWKNIKNIIIGSSSYWHNAHTISTKK